MISWGLLALVVTNQRPVLGKDDGHVECIILLALDELCYQFMISYAFRISQKNRTKADVSILILCIRKQNEEKPRFKDILVFAIYCTCCSLFP